MFAFSIYLLLLGVLYAHTALCVPTWVKGESGVAKFISRPDIKSQILVVETHRSDLVAPGYWFTAPYRSLNVYKNRFTPGDSGPLIFDSDGELVWSGASRLHDVGSAFDFRPVTFNGSTHFSFEHFRQQGFVLLNNSYDIVQTWKPTHLLDDLHEFNFIENSSRALISTVSRQSANLSTGPNQDSDRLIVSHGFQEVDILTGNVYFNWTAIDHLSVADSYVTKYERDGYFDFAHTNSVQKTKEGDYIISVRHLCAILKISGRDGSTIWQLGGKHSDFRTQGFEIAYQHHARLHEETDEFITISLFNNGADVHTQVNEYSAALLVRIDKAKMTAKLLQKWDRPDHGSSTTRGNVQMLPNGNVFVSWAEGGYSSEFTRDGTLVQEIYYKTDDMGSYRAYKKAFTAYPSEPPRMQVYAESSLWKGPKTSFYVSWNGATEVTSWKFYSLSEDGDETLIGTAPKKGFETEMIIDGLHNFTMAEAIAADGTSLGKTTVCVSDQVQGLTMPVGQFRIDGTDLKSFTPIMMLEFVAVGVIVTCLLIYFMRPVRRALARLFYSFRGKPASEKGLTEEIERLL